MTTSTAPLRIVYLAEGKLYLKQGELAPRLIESAFAQQILDRAQQNRERQEWKFRGDATNPFGSMLWGRRDQVPAEVRSIAVTGITRCPDGEGVIYALDTGAVGGLFRYEFPHDWEVRLFHKQEFRAHHLAHHPREETIALSLPNPDGSADLAVMSPGGKGVRRLTEGDSLDEMPAWLPDAERSVLVYQSAGIARAAQGFMTALGPYSIQRLDLDQQTHAVVLENGKYDYLVPRYDAAGNLYVIRRPYQEAGYRHVSPWRVALDMILFPFRLLRAIFGFLNFFSIMFSSKPLTTVGGPPGQKMQTKTMMLYGKMIDAEKALRAAQKGQAAPLVPATWELLKVTPDGATTALASSVLSFDLGADGTIVYTNGSEVYRLQADQPSAKVCAQRMIEQVLVL